MLGELETSNAPSVEMESRKRSLSSPGSAKKAKETFSTPPAKKLKQARLPFQAISSPPVTQIRSPSPNDRPSKKRKLSETDSNTASPQPTTKPKEKTDVTPSGKKSATKAASKKTPGKTPRVVKQPEPEQPVVEIEVTSSSEDAVTKSPIKKKKPKPLERFLQRTQQPTSTSDEEVIDLTDKEASDNKKDQTNQDQSAEKDKESLKKVVIVLEDSRDGCKDATTNSDQIDEIDSASGDEGTAADSILDSSTASEANTSISSEGSVAGDEHSKPPVSSQTSISSTPKSAPKPIKKTPKSIARELERDQEKEKKRLEKEKLKEEKRLKAEQEKAEKKKQKDAARLEKEAKAAEAKRLKELEKEQKRKEKEEKLAQEEKERLEKQALREEKEKERLEKKAQKEEKQKQRMKELEAKAEEKKKKEEERLQMEEEKNQREAVKRQAAEKQQNMFKSFFKKIETPVASKEPKEKCCGGFAPFQVKTDMALAPVYGFEKLQKAETKEQFDKLLKSQDDNNLYLKQLKSGNYKAGKRCRTQLIKHTGLNEDDEDSIQMLDDIKVKKTKTKAKLLQFHENYRPAYYGTWSKISQTVSPRNYLKKDEDFLDYEFDSDEEWEEPGESLSNSEGEDSDGDSEGGDDSDNDGFFVEHGYLSESEDPLDDDESVEQWRARRSAKALAWEVELKRQTQVLKPVIVGCFWVHGVENQNRVFEVKLQAFKAVSFVNVPVETSLSAAKTKLASEEEKRSPTPTSSGQTKSGAIQKKPVPEEAMPHLCRLVHGNTIGIKNLIREFREYWRLQQRPSTPQIPTPTSSSESPTTTTETRSVSPMPTPPSSSATSTTPLARASPDVDSSSTPKPNQTGEISSTNSTPEEPEIVHAISKRQLEMKIGSIAVREKRQDIYPRICWYVHKNILEKYNVTDLPVPCQWQHQTGPLAVKRSDSPLPVQNNILPPQKMMSAPATTARRIIPTKVGGLPSVMSMLQQQKSVPKTKQVVNSVPGQTPSALSGAAGVLANAAAMCSAQQQPPHLVSMLPTTSAAQIINTATLPVNENPPTLVQEPGTPITHITTTAIVHHPQSASPQAAENDASKTAKKVRTLQSFFKNSAKKSNHQDDTQSKSLKSNSDQNHQKVGLETERKMKDVEVTSSKVSPAASSTKKVKMDTESNMEVTEIASPTVFPAISSTKEVKTDTESKTEGVDVASIKVTPAVSTESKEKKPELAVIKDLLSKAKETRIKKQMSPERMKIKTPAKSQAGVGSVSGTSNETNKVDDKVEVITLD